MKKRAFCVLTSAILFACQGGDVTNPGTIPTSGPSSAIQDGANGGGNADFFFLPPMVDDPSGNALFLDNGFNASLTPTVEITATAYSFQANATLNVDYYQLNWQVPVSTTSKTYRVSVKVGTTELGFADVFAAANSADLKNADNDVVALKDGRTLPIKFVIENFALCTVPGTGPCSSETVDLATGGTVVTTFDGETTQSGVTIPPQPSGGTLNLTVQPCTNAGDPGFTDMNPAVTDIPTFGPCLSVVANPPAQPLVVPATVFVCDISDDADFVNLADHSQQHRVTLHRYDPGTLQALPHAPHACTSPVSSVGIRGVFAALARGSLRSAGSQLISMFKPRLLHAAVLDVGGGGFTRQFSAFQFAIPSKVAILSGDGQSAAPGAELPIDPTVLVTDLADVPVPGARVTFNPNNGSATPLVVVTGANGLASTNWTLGATPGTNTMTASGRGIASPGTDGPRCDFDPFQAIQVGGVPPHPVEFGPSSCTEGTNGPPDVPITLLTGSVTFTATGLSFGDVIVLNDINIFDNTGMGSTENNDFLIGIMHYTNTGPRASQSVVMFDVGRGTALCTTAPTVPYCPAQTGPGDNQFTSLRAAIIGMGLTISDVSSSSLTSNSVLRNIPSDVKAIFLWMPIESYAYDEINALKTFVGEGGRLVFIGENDGAYGPGATTGGWLDGDLTQDWFLADMGSAMTRTGGSIDNVGVTLPNSSLTLSPSSSAKHAIMTNVMTLFVAASAEVALGPSDATLFRNSGNSLVLGAVAQINLAPISPPPLGRLSSPAAVSARVLSGSAPLNTTSTIDYTKGPPQ